MKKSLVIGGGFAGLSAAVYLSNKDHNVTLIESSPKLGGRAFSILNPETGSEFDNGQHIMMGCYKETLAFLSLINAQHLLVKPGSLLINFVKKDGVIYKLSASSHHYPFNLLKALLNFKALRFRSRIKIIDLFLDLVCCYACDLKGKSVKEWLLDKRQTDEAIRNFWGIIAIGALNTEIDRASAQIFASILKRIFFDGTESSAILLAKSNLNSLYVYPSLEFLRSRGADVRLSERVIKFETSHQKITRVLCNRSAYESFDFVISAVPSYSLIRILDNSSIGNVRIPVLEYSSILNVHLWLSENPFSEPFYGFLDGEIHWLFNHGSHISLTISGADRYNDLPDEKILQTIYSDLEIFFTIFNSSLVTEYKIIKEKRATFIPDMKSIESRSSIKSPINNLILAGDWTNTELPSTIESAVLSGRIAADSVD